MDPGYRSEKPLGYRQLNVDTAQGLGAIPFGTVFAIIVPETQMVRFRDDGTAPTTAVGMPLPALARLKYTPGNLGALQFISSPAGAVLNIAFYG